MFKKSLLVPAVLGVAGLLMASNSAFAQRGVHSGGHSGAHMSGGHSGGHGGAHYSGHNHGYYHPGYGYYPGSFGGIYPWYDAVPWSSYSDAQADRYYEPFTPYISTPTTVVADSAYIDVIVPDSQAHVWFDGQPTSQSGTDRLFHTPSLTMASTASYQVRASWMKDGREMSQERTISVTPGRTTVVDFTR